MGNFVDYIVFKIYKEGDDLYGWLGVFFDGFIDVNFFRIFSIGGILEVKCLYNKGSLEMGVLWVFVLYYYML